ncbi:hypothetical protein T439DRAFT_356769 [Meredithblackwellia eburnea MCA 4105]
MPPSNSFSSSSILCVLAIYPSQVDSSTSCQVKTTSTLASVRLRSPSDLSSRHPAVVIPGIVADGLSSPKLHSETLSMESALLAAIPKDKVLGALLLGSWANIVLYTVEVFQLWRYFSLYPQDGKLIKSSVVLASVSDSVSTIVTLVTVYQYTITNWGNVLYLLRQPVYFSIHVLFTLPPTIITQIYLGGRIYRLMNTVRDRATAWTTGVTAVLGACIVASLAVGLWVSAILMKFRTIQDRPKLTAPIIAWASTGGATDVFLSALLVILVVRMQKETPLNSNSRMTPVIQRLLIRAIESGVILAAIALLPLILFLNDKSSNAQTAASFCIGRVYTLTLLSNLLGRHREESIVDHSGEGTDGRSRSKSSYGAGTGVHTKIQEPEAVFRIDMRCEE